MLKLVVAFTMLIVALIGTAIYVQYASSTLSLPISTGLTVLTILLPLFAATNIIYTPILNRLVRSPTLLHLLVPALHVLQGVLAVVIATLAAQGFADGQILNCKLEANWQLFWSNHDGRSLERIQNTFGCCGFHSAVDRAWPRERGQCGEIYNRDTSCDAPWRAYMQRTSGLQFAVAVLASIIQLAHLAYLRRRAIRNNAAQDLKRLPHDSERMIEEEYSDSDNEAASVDQSPSSNSVSPTTRDEAPHRVEPSGLGRDEANEWRS